MPKTVRCYARINGIDRSMFTVEEGNKFGLTIWNEMPTYFFDGEGSGFELDNQHYSVHIANDGANTLITQKTELKDGKPRSQAAFVHDTRNYLMWPVYARRVPTWKSSDLMLKDKEDSLKLADYDSNYSQFYYSVFAANANFRMSGIKVKNANAHIIRFSVLSLVIFTTYQHFSTFERGGVCGIPTSSEVIGKVPSADHKQVHVTSLPARKVKEVHLGMMNFLVADLWNFLPQYVDHDPQMLEILASQTRYFSKRPMINPRNLLN